MSPGMLFASRKIANSLTDKRERNLDCGRVTAYPSVTGWLSPRTSARVILCVPSDRNTKLNSQYAHINATLSSCAG